MMPEDIIKIRSISQFHELVGLEKPKHPLISIIDVSKVKLDNKWLGKRFSSSLYTIALKDASCAFEYGRNHYDFNEGVMIFTGPDQVMKSNQEQPVNPINGWMIYFHPDLIRNTSLGGIIENYSFFSYDVHEALHLSDEEQTLVTDIMKMIRQEVKERIDNHSQRVIVSSLELLLNLCTRFYERQFNTRTSKNKDIVSQMESLLKDYYQSGKLAEIGQPSIQFCANELHLSPNYLSDLLKKETGRSAKDHINDFVVDKAKTLLLGSTDSIGEIAYSLGYNYPHYFSRFFKSKTGFTPQEYRIQN